MESVFVVMVVVVVPKKCLLMVAVDLHANLAAILISVILETESESV